VSLKNHVLFLIGVPAGCLSLAAAADATGARPVFTAPAGTLYCQIQPQGVTVIPNGRLLTPRGQQIVVEPHPYGLTLSPDGQTAVTVNSGTEPFSLCIVRGAMTDAPQVLTVPESVRTDAGILNACFMGVAIDQHRLYAAGGDDGTVMIWDLIQAKRRATVDLNIPFRGRSWRDSYTGDLVLSPDRTRLYVVDQMNFRVVALDTVTHRITDVIPVGRYPFGLCLSPDGSTLYVANIGLFEYSAITDFDPNDFRDGGLSFAPFPYLSRDMIDGATVEGRVVPGLGDPNVPEAVSLYAVDLRRRDQGRVVARIKTGVRVGQKVEGIPALGGSSPNSVVTNGRRIYVSNGMNDSITVVDAPSLQRIGDIRLRLPEPLHRLRGIIPFGLALSPDGRRLYVAESGINAVGVIDTDTHAVLGHIPVGWFPSKLAVTPDGRRLVVANAKGFGAGPNGGPGVHYRDRSDSIGNLMRGTVSVLDIPPDTGLAAETGQVLENNVRIGLRRPWESAKRNPVPPYVGAYDSPIKHVVLIFKENRTYDQVFGELPGGRGYPGLTDFGLNTTVRSAQRSGEGVEQVNVMPNHQALARRYACSDNFYCDSDHSADGHRWLQGVYPGVWTETGTSASYGGRRRYLLESSAPGRRAVTGAYAALLPEDYLEVGSLWDHLDRHDVDFFNFGMGFEFPGSEATAEFPFTGIRLAVNYPIPAPLWERTSRLFATYNTNIPDQFRVDMFEKEWEERWLSGREPFPRLIVMSLPNDHGAGERPEAGYPFRESYMADNDLALGRVVARLSRTEAWSSMAIIVTEDDAQNGRDHVDAHRSLCLVVSPYAKRGYVSHVHVSIPSILKTAMLILGIPFINQYDAMASDLSDLFQAEPDATPYGVLPVHPEVFDPNRALDPFDEAFDWAQLQDYPKMDDPEILRDWRRQDAERRESMREGQVPKP
jgi:YVTN family beta-propeller protein